MSRFAKIISTDAVQGLATALNTFKEEATAALDNLELEVRRALDWILHDRKEYWDGEVRRGWDRVAEARAELERRMTFHRIGEHQPACRDEKMALEKAKRRLRTAEEKVELVRRWRHRVEHELTDYRGAVNQLASWLQTDHPRALADLKRMIDAIQSYVALHVPAETSTDAVSSSPAEPTEELSPGSCNNEDMGPDDGCRESGRRDEDARDG